MANSNHKQNTPDSARDPIEHNPFEELDLPSTLAPRELTRILRERAEDLPSSERGTVRSGWQALTVSDRERSLFVLFARQRVLDPASRQKLQVLLRLTRTPSPPSPPPSADDLISQLTASDLRVPPNESLSVAPGGHDERPISPLVEDPFFALESPDDLD